MSITIGFDASRAFIKSRTGTENYAYQLLKALSRIDLKNKYQVYLRPNTKITENWPDNFSFKIINWPRLWTQAGLSIQTFKDKIDVLFVPSHTIPIIKKPGLKTVVTVHDLGSEYLPQMHQLKQQIYLSFMQKHQLKHATKIIAVSKATKMDLIEKIGISPNKIEVVYEGFDRNNFKDRSEKSKTDPLINSLIPFYLFVGTVQPRKNLDRVIRAFAEYSKVSKEVASLIIVGSKGWLSDEIYKLPEKLGIVDRVKFLGYIPDEKLPMLYSKAKALLFPSLFEGFGLPIIEAQACGCLVITSKISSMPEVSGKGAILVNPYSIDDIVRGIKESQNSKLRNDTIKAGFENIKRFSWEKCAKETLQVLEEVGK